LTSVVVDTNVLVAANGRATQAGPRCVTACTERLSAIVRDGRVALDDRWLIIREYQRLASSSGQPGVGDAFLKWVLTNRTSPARSELVHVTPRDGAQDEFEEFPDDPELARFDRADRKYVAVARASPSHPPVLNATDRDWWLAQEALARYEVHVEFLCPELMGPR
jgi:hypothetical protein